MEELEHYFRVTFTGAISGIPFRGRTRDYVRLDYGILLYRNKESDKIGVYQEVSSKEGTVWHSKKSKCYEELKLKWELQEKEYERRIS